jgi:putative flippase GtrA
MKKRDIIAAFIIGEACALIFLLVLNFREFPSLIVASAKFLPLILPLLSISGVWFVSLFEENLPVLFQASKSFLVGILNTFIDLGILTILMETFQLFEGLAYLVFVGISFTGATINSYFWNKFWTFGKRETKEVLRETSQFYLITIGGLLIHLGITSFLVNILGPQFGISKEIWAYFGKIVAVFLGFIWNFLGYKFIVFQS